MLNILSPFIFTLHNNGISENEIIGLLMRVYDMNNPSDLLLIARAAKDSGSIELARQIITLVGEKLGQ